MGKKKKLMKQEIIEHNLAASLDGKLVTDAITYLQGLVAKHGTLIKLETDIEEGQYGSRDHDILRVISWRQETDEEEAARLNAEKALAETQRERDEQLYETLRKRLGKDK